MNKSTGGIEAVNEKGKRKKEGYIRPMKMSDKEKEEKDITEQLGPITEFHVKMRLPQAFVDYVEEVAIKQNREAASLEEYCNQEFLAGLIAYLDNEEERVLKNYTIPKFIALQYDEIMDTYLSK